MDSQDFLEIQRTLNREPIQKFEGQEVGSGLRYLSISKENKEKPFIPVSTGVVLVRNYLIWNSNS